MIMRRLLIVMLAMFAARVPAVDFLNLESLEGDRFTPRV